MLIPRKPTRDAMPKLDDLAAVGRHEGEGAEADPFDEAMVAAVAGPAEAMKAQNAKMEAVRGRMVRLARQVPR